MSDAPIDRRFQKHQVIPNSSPSPTPQDDLDVVAFIGINLRRNGAMSVGGHIGDKNFALAMLDNARDALLRQIPANENMLIPGREVAVPEFGDFGPKANPIHPLATQYFTAHAARVKASTLSAEYPMLLRTEEGTFQRWRAAGCPLVLELKKPVDPEPPIEEKLRG